MAVAQHATTFNIVSDGINVRIEFIEQLSPAIPQPAHSAIIMTIDLTNDLILKLPESIKLGLKARNDMLQAKYAAERAAKAEAH